MLYRIHSWNLLREMARRGGVRIFAKAVGAQRVAELDREIADLMAEAKAITALAEEEKRELSADEEKQLSEILDEETGKVYALKAERARVEKLLAMKKRMAAEISATQGSRGIRDNGPGEVEPSQPPLPAAARRLRGLKAFSGDDAQRDAYVSGMYLRARIAQVRGDRDAAAEEYLEARGLRAGGHGAGIQAVHTEGTNSAGGFLVPDPLSSAILDVRDRHTVMRPLCTVVPMTSDTLKIPKRTGGLTVQYPGEATAITASDATLAQVSLVAVKRAVFTQISSELRDDALISMVDFAVSEIGTALGLNEDREIISGDGSAGFGGVTGLVSALNASGKLVATGAGSSTWAGLTLKHFTDTMALLPDRFGQYENVWVVSRAFYYSVMLPLLAAAQGNTIATLEAGAADSPRFLRHRVVFCERMPKATAVSSTVALFGAFDQAVIIGDRQGIIIGQSDQFAFNLDVLTVRATARYDVEVHEPGASGAPGAYVGLVTAAS